MNLNSISETLLRRRTTTSTQQQQNNVDTNNNGVGNTFGVNFSTSTLASALLISSMNQPSSPRHKKSTNNNGDHKENVGEDKTSSGRHRQKDDKTSTAKNNMPPPPPPPPPPGPPPARRRPRNKKINSSLVDDTTKKPSSSSISSSGNSKSISPTLLQRRQMNPLSPVNNNSPMNRNQRGVDIGRSALMKEQKSGNASASDCTTYRSNKSPIVAMNISKVERRRPIVSTSSTRSPKERTQNNQATEAARGTTTSTDKKLVSPQPKKQEASNHQVAIKSHTSTTTHTTKSLSPAMKKIIAKYGSGRDCSVNHKLLTSPNISDRKHQQHDTIAKQQQASTTSNTLDTNRYLANKALQLKRSRQQSIQTNVINTKRKEANKKADIVKQFRQQKHRGRCTSSRAMKNDSTTSTTAAKETSNDFSRVPRRRSLSVPRKTTKSLEDGLEEIDIQTDNLAVTQSCSFTTTRTTDTNVDNDETNKRRLQMRRKRAREVLARRNKKI